MTDIVERLEIAAQHDTPHDTLMSEAADEIERLRAALDKICNGPRDADLDYVDLFVDVKMEARAALEGRDDLA